MVLSGYVSDANGIESGILIKHGVEFEKQELNLHSIKQIIVSFNILQTPEKTDTSELLLHPMIPMLEFMLFLFRII